MKQPEEFKHLWELVVVALLLWTAFKPKKPIGYFRGKVFGESLRKAHYRQYLLSPNWKTLRAQKLKEALYRVNSATAADRTSSATTERMSASGMNNSPTS